MPGIPERQESEPLRSTAPRVVLIGTLDTKGRECSYLRSLLIGHGLEVVVVDVGILGEPGLRADVTRETVASRAGMDVERLASVGDRGRAVEAMARGARAVVRELAQGGGVDGIVAIGGSGNATIAAEAMRTLPVGVPKLLVSTVASGDTRPYLHGSDITLMYPVVDIAGINRILEPVLKNAAAALAGMVKGIVKYPRRPASATSSIAATMFGVTTPCVDAARELLGGRGYEVLVFHATGTGGRSMEELISGGSIRGVLDITTSELANELLGGVASAGPCRLEAAGRYGIPQVVSLGALDIVNFGPPETIPSQYQGRVFYSHNAATIAMRTTKAECAELALIMARKLNTAVGPVAVFIPLRGISELDAKGRPFYDPEADSSLFTVLQANLSPKVEVRVMDSHINDPLFARAMAERLDEMLKKGSLRE